ncbi:UNVERIFIED_CONTAM: aspartate ammonia-lyase [Euhalothece sp. KZN 001]
MSEGHRTERDSLGAMEVPADAYWGAQTQRAVENFPISGATFGRRFIRALGVVKLAAVRTNVALGLVDAELGAAIETAAECVIAGELDDQFVVDIFQTGSGTSSNMNANEVIANRAAEELGASRGERVVHPNDHVNYGQSSNDVIPTAMHIAVREAMWHDVIPALEHLHAVLRARAEEFDPVVKTGRTHLQDATPITLGQEFTGYATQLAHGIDRLEAADPRLAELALGGTAVGTGLNTHPEFPKRTATAITAITDLEFTPAESHFEAMAAHDAMAEVHGALRTVAGSMHKIANDLRLLASGPRNGMGEIDQPENQPGSSIMPGKINPVVAEAVNQVHAAIIGNDVTVATGAAGGQLELNLYKPIIAHRTLESCRLLGQSAEVFADRFIARLSADTEQIAAQVEQSMALATALNPTIGYDAAAAVAKEATATGKSIREVAIDQGHLTPEQADAVLDPRRMTERGILGDDA